MMNSQRLSILILLALGMSSRALARIAAGSLTLADVQDKAHAALEAAHVKNQARHLRSLQSFNDTCIYMQDTFQQSGFNCTCGSDTLTCLLPSDCTDDANAVCADFEMSLKFNPDSGMGSVNVCVKHTSDPTGENRDVCVSFAYGSDLTTIDSCSVQIEDASGSLTNCTTCEPCSDGASLNIDCTNILPDATTNGCTAFSLSNGDSTQNVLQNLGGSGGGGGGTTTGNSTTGGESSGSGGGSSGNGGSNGGTGSNGAGTSSGVTHRGARAAVLLSGVALALVM